MVLLSPSERERPPPPAGIRPHSLAVARIGPSSSSRDLKPQLLCLLNLDRLLPALHDVLGLDPHDASAPAPADLGVVVELRLEAVRKLVQLGLVLLPHCCEGNARR